MLKVKGSQFTPIKFDLQGLGLTTFNPDNSILEGIRKSVERLELQDNNLIYSPNFGGDRSSWTNLTHLDLSRNGLGKVDKLLFALPVIHELKLGHNNLKMLPKDLKCSPTLMVLRLENNQLTSLPNKLEKTSINSINLEHNNFESVPTFLCNMDGLKYLNLSYNEKILEFPLEFGRLPPEIMLDLKGMQVCAIRYWF